MKKVIALALTVVLIAALAVPVMGQIGTGGTVKQGGGEIPIIKCKWEQEPIPDFESGDVPHAVPGTQILPPLQWGAIIPVCFYVVVTDAEQDIFNVYVDVYHPIPGPPGVEGTKKYQLQLEKMDYQAGIDAFVAVGDPTLLVPLNLISYAAPYDFAEVLEELEKGTAWVYTACGPLDYEQPAGDYRVVAKAIDGDSNWAVPLENFFLYMPVCQIEIDFTSINYGSITISTNKWLAGDTPGPDWDPKINEPPAPVQWSDPPAPAGDPPAFTNRATVRNVGNTWLYVTVMQDDMGLDKTLLPSGAWDWNVRFDARMGNDPANEVFYDPVEDMATGTPTQLPNILPLSRYDELDFSIHIKKWDTQVTTLSGAMELGCVIAPF
jgi:hypothetical protein